MRVQKWLLLLVLGILSGKVFSQTPAGKYEPNFPSLEKSNPVPEWFKDAKFGIYFHWGVYSVPAFSNEWYPRNMYIKDSRENKHHREVFGETTDFPYDKFITGANDKSGKFLQFAPKLKSEGGKFDPEEWAQLFADAGAKFAGPVAEHHDGFSMWASKVNPWNAKEMGPKQDLVGLLTGAIRKRNLKIILSMHHAFNITGFYSGAPTATDPKFQTLYGQLGKEKNEELWLAKHKEIIDNYKPDIIWQDFNLHRISQSVLLGFLSYYYNKAAEWKKQVVATYKDGLNTKTGVLDYERGGPVDITDNYWLTDDAISQTSWSYTEGLKYYSKKQILHGFLDRISKNGNLLLNISPMADGTIPQDQKEILLSMGTWLKKYGEAVYATRAWQRYGEGPTKMGAAHGVFQAPAEGTAKDIRYTRSKDNSKLYAIVLGWEQGQKELLLTALPSDRIDLKTLKSVQLINGAAGKYITLTYKQTAEGLVVNLPERGTEDLAYVIKLTFNGKIPVLNNYAEINSAPHYYIIPGNKTDSLTLNAFLQLEKKKNIPALQWKLESIGKGYYKIVNRESKKVLALTNTMPSALSLAPVSNAANQVWKIETSYYGLYKITNKQYPTFVLSVNGDLKEQNAANAVNTGNQSFVVWQLQEVCEQKVEAYKPLLIPGIIEAEDFNKGCPGEAYLDRDEANNGGEYRPNETVDIEKKEGGGFVVTRTSNGEWLTYTATVQKTGNYQVSFVVNSPSDNGKIRLEYDGKEVLGAFTLPNTQNRQDFKSVTATLKLDQGQHILKLIFDSRGVAIDKIIIEEVK